MPTEPAATVPPGPTRRLAFGVLVAVVVLNLYPVLRPMLLCDDFQVLVRGWTWERTRATWWEPQNEHAMPLGRLSTRLVVWLAGRPTHLPCAAALHGPLFLLLALALLYLFVSRELCHPFYGVAGMAIFGVTTLYQQAVSWFAASFAVPALCTLLLGLLAAQRWRESGRFLWLGLCALACALAPGWFASGVLAGPLCALYLILAAPPPRSAVSRAASALAPVLGTAAFLAVSLPRTAEYIMHLEHYGNKTATQAFNPLVGLGYTLRSLVDNLALGAVGISGVHSPVWLVPLGLLLLACGAVWWWRHAANHRLLVLGLGFIFSNYLLVYSARAEWDYKIMVSPGWGRYHLFAQLGLALFVSGGLPRLLPPERLSPRVCRWLTLGIAVLTVAHLPRCAALHWLNDPDSQRQAFTRIEEVDRRCNTYHIDAATARQALDPLEVPGCWGRENGWDFLTGSPTPQPWTAEEARVLLAKSEGETSSLRGRN